MVLPSCIALREFTGFMR